MEEALHCHFHFRLYLQSHTAMPTGKGGLFTTAGHTPGQRSHLLLVPWKMRGWRCVLLGKKEWQPWNIICSLRATIDPSHMEPKGLRGFVCLYSGSWML